jgi:hypothetical protein
MLTIQKIKRAATNRLKKRLQSRHRLVERGSQIGQGLSMWRILCLWVSDMKPCENITASDWEKFQHYSKMSDLDLYRYRRKLACGGFLQISESGDFVLGDPAAFKSTPEKGRAHGNDGDTGLLQQPDQGFDEAPVN